MACQLVGIFGIDMYIQFGGIFVFAVYVVLTRDEEFAVGLCFDIYICKNIRFICPYSMLTV